MNTASHSPRPSATNSIKRSGGYKATAVFFKMDSERCTLYAFITWEVWNGNSWNYITEQFVWDAEKEFHLLFSSKYAGTMSDPYGYRAITIQKLKGILYRCGAPSTEIARTTKPMTPTSSKMRQPVERGLAYKT